VIINLPGDLNVRCTPLARFLRTRKESKSRVVYKLKAGQRMNGFQKP